MAQVRFDQRYLIVMCLLLVALILGCLYYTSKTLGNNPQNGGVGFGTLPDNYNTNITEEEKRQADIASQSKDPLRWDYGVRPRHLNPITLSANGIDLSRHIPYISRESQHLSNPLNNPLNPFNPPLRESPVIGPGGYQIMGYLRDVKGKHPDKMLQLYGQYNGRSNYSYYAYNPKNGIKMPIRHRNNSELFNDDIVDIEGLRGQYVVHLYDINWPRYVI